MIISSNYKFPEVEVLYQRGEQIKNFELHCKNPLQIDYIYLYSQIIFIYIRNVRMLLFPYH